MRITPTKRHLHDHVKSTRDLLRVLTQQIKEDDWLSAIDTSELLQAVAGVTRNSVLQRVESIEARAAFERENRETRIAQLQAELERLQSQ